MKKSSKSLKKIYPRVDKEYRSKTSLDFENTRSNISQTRPTGTLWLRLASWFVFLMLGVLVGVTAFVIDVLVEYLVLYKWEITEIIFKGSVSMGWLTFMVFSLLFGGTAALMTVFLGPGAVGGGTAELMGYYNGINYPDLISLRTLFVKVLGLGLAVASGLCIGKEGPLAHIGAILAHALLYVPGLPFLAFFRNDNDKREMAAAGAAAGVAAAFGSPIGGSLFAYEISRPSTFWTFDLMWKTFFCSSISTFVLNILSCVRQGRDVSIVNAGLIKFGQYDEHPYKLHDFPFFIMLGAMGGLLGALFVFVNHKINKYRKKYLVTKWQKVLETVCLTFLTCTFIYYAPMLIKSDCIQQEEGHIEASFIQYKCPNEQYSPLATLLLNPENTVIKALLNKQAKFNYEPLLIFFLVWYLFTSITYGTSVPAGLFLPGILIGGSLGRMVGLFIESYIIEEGIRPSTYAIIGSASILAGYTRLSFSLAVIMLETTENVSLFLPIIFALVVSFGIGRIFNRSLYVGSVRFKNLPFLIEEVPACNRDLKAANLMSTPVFSLPFVCKVEHVYTSLHNFEFDGFPVVDDLRKLQGLISRQNLTVLLKK